MFDLWLGKTIRRYYRLWIDRFTEEAGTVLQNRPAVVFAPHQDDETLGCGGTILIKRKAGASVKIVFMTDGRTSHSQFLPPDELIAVRKHEAIGAGQKLGLEEDDLIFLAFQDEQLLRFQEQAILQVQKILHQYRPDEVFIPYFRDSQPDHLATNQIVLAALKHAGHQAVVYEYPVWFWYHWPWVRFRQASVQDTKKVLKNTLKASLGLKLLKDFRWAVSIEPVSAEKRVALNQHQSQMTRFLPHPGWPTLPDVSEGDFLDCFFQKKELFRRFPYPDLAKRTRLKGNNEN